MYMTGIYYQYIYIIISYVCIMLYHIVYICCWNTQSMLLGPQDMFFWNVLLEHPEQSVRCASHLHICAIAAQVLHRVFE